MYVLVFVGFILTGLDPAWIALIATICGGVGLKFTEHWLGRNKIKSDDASSIRDELRLEITSLKTEVKELEENVNKWREEYYDLRDKYTEQSTTLGIMQSKLDNK